MQKREQQTLMALVFANFNGLQDKVCDSCMHIQNEAGSFDLQLSNSSFCPCSCTETRQSTLKNETVDYRNSCKCEASASCMQSRRNCMF